jgi:hypothetical protein
MCGRLLEKGEKVSLQENTKGLHIMIFSAAVFKVGHIMITSQLHLISFRIKQFMRNTVMKLGLSAVVTNGRHGDAGTWH